MSLLRVSALRNPGEPGRYRNYEGRYEFVPAEFGFQFLFAPHNRPWRYQLASGKSFQLLSAGGMLLARIDKDDVQRGNLSLAATLSIFEEIIGLGVGADLYRGVPVQGADGQSGSDTAFTGLLAWSLGHRVLCASTHDAETLPKLLTIRNFIDPRPGLRQDPRCLDFSLHTKRRRQVMFRGQQSRWFALCGALLLGPVAACADDDEGPSGGNEAGKSSGGGEKGGSSSPGGSAAKGGSGGFASEEPLAGGAPMAGAGAGGESAIPMAEGVYVVGYYLQVQDEYIGYLAVTDDLSASGSVALEGAIEFPGDMSYASPGNGVIYVGRGSAPVIERWVLNEERQLVKDGELGLSQYGITSGLGIKDPFHFISEDRAYFIDGKTRQVVIWDPQAMKTVDSFELDGLAEGDLFVSPNYVHRDGDRLLLSARYYRPDDTAALLTRVAVIDTTTDSVEYMDDDRCGNIAFHAHDSQNNLYLASHPAQAAVVAVGAAGDPIAESCIIRIKAGANQFDPDYYVSFQDVVGAPAGGIMQGAGNEAFVLRYAGAPLTLDNYASAHRRADWEVDRLTLGEEESTLEKVDGIELQSAYGLAFSTPVDGKNVPYIITVAGDLSAGRYHDVSAPGEVTPALELPGFPGKAILVK